MGKSTAERKEEFLKALEESKCNVSIACKNTGMSRNTPYKWRETDKRFAKRWDELYDGVRDFVVGKLMAQIDKGNLGAICFWLKCREGWSEKQRIEFDNSNDIDIRLAIEEIKNTLND